MFRVKKQNKMNAKIIKFNLPFQLMLQYFCDLARPELLDNLDKNSRRRRCFEHVDLSEVKFQFSPMKCIRRVTIL